MAAEKEAALQKQAAVEAEAAAARALQKREQALHEERARERAEMEQVLQARTGESPETDGDVHGL